MLTIKLTCTGLKQGRLLKWSRIDAIDFPGRPNCLRLRVGLVGGVPGGVGALILSMYNSTMLCYIVMNSY